MLDLTDYLPDSPALELFRNNVAPPHHEGLLYAADLVATQIVRGTPQARDLSDAFSEAGVRLPLLNWPKSALDPLDAPARDRILRPPAGVDS